MALLVWQCSIFSLSLSIFLKVWFLSASHFNNKCLKIETVTVKFIGLEIVIALALCIVQTDFIISPISTHYSVLKVWCSITFKTKGFAQLSSTNGTSMGTLNVINGPGIFCQYQKRCHQQFQCLFHDTISKYLFLDILKTRKLIFQYQSTINFVLLNLM